MSPPTTKPPKRRKWPPPAGEDALKLAEAIATLKHGLSLVEELLGVPERHLLRQLEAGQGSERHWVARDLGGIAYALPMSLDMLESVLPAGVCQLAERLQARLARQSRRKRDARRAASGARAG